MKTEKKELVRVRKAEIVEVKGPDIRISDPFTGKRSDYGNYTVVEDELGEKHFLKNGSTNQVPEEIRIVGVKGTVEFISTGSWSLWFFSPYN